MSRYDYRDPGTDPAYCDGLDWRNDVTRDSDPSDQEAAGIDVPDFDAPDVPAPGTYAVVGGGPGYASVTTDPPIDPAEHCVQAIIAALKDLEWITAANTDLSRAFVLRQLLHKAWMAVSRTDEAMIAGLDRIMERRR